MVQDGQGRGAAPVNPLNSLTSPINAQELHERIDEPVNSINEQPPQGDLVSTDSEVDSNPELGHRRPDTDNGPSNDSDTRGHQGGHASSSNPGSESADDAPNHPVASYHQQQILHHQQRAEELLRQARVHDQIARDHAAMADIYRNKASAARGDSPKVAWFDQRHKD